MAITLVGETTELISASTTENVTLPGTPAEGDLVLVGVGGDRAYSSAITTTGYNLIHETVGSATAPQCTLKYKFMGETPDSTVAIQNDQTGGCLGVVCIKVFRGVDQSTPQDTAAVVATNTTGMPDADSLTTVTNGAWRVLFGVVDDDEVTDTSLPATFSNLLNQETTGGGDTLDATAMMCHREEATAGALDPAAFGGSGSDAWVCVHAALRPAAGTVEGAGSSSGVATVSGVGASTAAAAGSSSGTGTASGVGQSTAASDGASAGVATVSGVGSSTAASDGASAGVATVSGVGASTAEAVGSSAGVATVSGVGAGLNEQGAGSASGTSTVSGVGASTAEAVGSASGTSSVSGVGLDATVASVAVEQGGHFVPLYEKTGRKKRRKKRKQEIADLRRTLEVAYGLVTEEAQIEAIVEAVSPLPRVGTEIDYAALQQGAVAIAQLRDVVSQLEDLAREMQRRRIDEEEAIFLLTA